MDRGAQNVNPGDETAKKVFESAMKSGDVDEGVNSDAKIKKDNKSSIKSGDNIGGSCEDTNQEEVGQRMNANVKVKKLKGVNAVNPDNLEKIFDIEDLDKGSKSCLYSKRLNQAGGCSDCAKRPIGGDCK